MGGGVPTDDAMRTFRHRALEAEDRITRLEALISGRQEMPTTSSQDLSSRMTDLKLQIQELKPELEKDHLTRLETLVATKKEEPNSSSQNFSSIIRGLKLELQAAQNELKSKKDEACQEIKKLDAENSKLQYRIKHLVRAVKEADAEILAASNQGA